MTHRKDRERRGTRRPPEPAILVSRADWRQAYQDALRIAKQRDGDATLAAELLNNPFLASVDRMLAVVDNAGHSIRVTA